MDWTVHYGTFERLFGIPSIPIYNGVDVDVLSVSKSVAVPGLLRLIAVGNWSHWHGLDRLIIGIANYYSDSESFTNCNVKLTIVGGGREVNTLRHLVERLGLTSIIHFVPPATGRHLDSLFDQADIAIGSLGLFRLGLECASPLKHREYCARGLPMVLSTIDEAFPGELDWVCYMRENNEPLPVEKIVSFFFGLGHSSIRTSIRRHALEHLTWNSILTRVMEKMR